LISFPSSVFARLDCQAKSLQYIFPSSDRWEFAWVLLRNTAWERFDSLVIVDREEERYAVSFLVGSIYDSMHGAFIDTISPSHQEVGDIHYDTAFEGSSGNPLE
jgi:hypothetical protein